ncbi:MAG: CDP-alcohol phosphatidyltransferase family protein [Proteobacteria bacterium]|jgi:phosphatidylglycerophosphate synthase|nr:CDP-alcohol phosphatidyltransferase family protein [Pseudomonadota bacterium]
MLDASFRPVIDVILRWPARILSRFGIGANSITIIGGVMGISAFILVSFGFYQSALAFIVLNRLADGMDGAIARENGSTDLGGYLDIVFDFLFYALIPLGFAIANPDHTLAAAFLIFTFIGTASSFLAFAVIAAKRGMVTEKRGRKSFYFLGGLTEGAETFGFLVLICLFPAWFNWLALGFGILCIITTVTRVLIAVDAFNDAFN